MKPALIRLLAMDTSTTSLTIALLEGERLIGEAKAIAERNHSIYLVPSILDMLHTAETRLQDVDGVAVGKGPGSYTGVRIGASVAKTLAWTLKIPLLGVSSLEAMALSGASESIAAETEWIVPMMDARRGQVFTGLYEVREGRSSCLLPDGIRLLSDWMEQLSSYIEEHRDGTEAAAGLRLVGETTPFRTVLDAPDVWRGIRTEIRETSIRAYSVGRLASQRWQRGEQDEVHAFAPNYTQLAEAEANYLARQQRQEPQQ
jgi:tRNA threonylcarbamoyladenosine biosynthesis protein TsaB